MRNLFLFGLLKGIVGIAIVRHEVLEGVLRQEANELWRVLSRDRTKLGDCISQAILGDIPGDDHSIKKGLHIQIKARHANLNIVSFRARTAGSMGGGSETNFDSPT